MFGTNALHANDRDIREPLIRWIAAQHPNDGSTGIIQEFQMPRPVARIDVAVVNGELAGFEIKSDVDTLIRLRTQVPAFSRFFDKVSVVTTAKHLKRTRETIPKWWGIVLFRPDRSFKVARSAKQNRNLDPVSLLFALSKAEIKQIVIRANSNVSSSLKKKQMIELAISSISQKEIFFHARDVIRLRKAN